MIEKKSLIRSSIVWIASLFSWVFYLSTAQAIEAGQYYYFISDRCVAKGPQTPQARGAVTPDLMLFEVIPAGISDYYVNMNTNTLVHYTPDGQKRLTEYESKQAYTAGKSMASNLKSHAVDGAIIHHDFMLQREAIDLPTLIEALNSFSQLQNDKGYFFKTLVGLSDPNAKFKAITRVRLTDNGIANRLLLNDYTSEYYLLDTNGKAASAPFIKVDHSAALRRDIHPAESPFTRYTQHAVCAEKWVP